MTESLSRGAIGGIVLDIEGTTTPISFVHDVLFPYARAHMAEYLREHAGRDELNEVTALLRDEWSADVANGAALAALTDTNRIADYLFWLMDRDRKSPALKRIQGRIWQRGYDDGTLRGAIYPDVPEALEAWRAAGCAIAIYSSGSVLAQRSLFAHSTAGDLTRFIDHYFDTGVGPKRSPDSYANIARQMERSASVLLFVSDVVDELDAAQDAGYYTLLCDRSGRAPGAIRSFEEIKGL